MLSDLNSKIPIIIENTSINGILEGTGDKKNFRLNYLPEGYALEVEKINISKISKDLQIPKESVRRKVEELEKAEIIKRKGKKIFVNRIAIPVVQANLTLKNMSVLLCEFNKILKEEDIVELAYPTREISDSIKKNFSFVWYQFYKFLFIFTNRCRKEVGDLETFCIGLLVLVNSADNKSFRIKDLSLKTVRERNRIAILTK